MPLTGLSPSPEFALTAQASGAWARKVTRPELLRDAIEQAIHVVETERRCALLDVRCLQD
jgi:acetolactate synthase-1/2/3 large subunit